MDGNVRIVFSPSDNKLHVFSASIKLASSKNFLKPTILDTEEKAFSAISARLKCETQNSFCYR